MFDYVRNNKKITQLFLALITLPFAFFGIEAFVSSSGGGAEVARVGNSKIYMQELENALREQQERLRPQLGARFDPAIFNTPQMRRSVLDNLINQRLLAQYAKDNHFSISDADLIRFISGIPALQEDGKFSPERYASVVAAQGMSKEMFEARLRQDLATQQLILPIDAVITGSTSARLWLNSLMEQREISEVRLLPEAYLAQVKLASDAVTRHYEANRSQFELPEQVRAEYVVLAKDVLQESAAISADDIKARYQSKLDAFKAPETRRASHILITAGKDAPMAEIKTAETRAMELLGKIKKSPGDFARLARESSQDPGSAAKGGDLDWFGRGMMVKPFEAAVFAMKEGETSELVRSDFGFHIIRVTGIRAERIKPLDEVQAEITAELKQEAAIKKFAEAAEAFGNMVYEQSDSLKPAAEKWKLQLRQTDWISNATKAGGKLPAPFNNAKLASSLFGEDAIKNKRNTESVEVAPGTLVAARVLEHRPASLQPLESVRAGIEKYLMREEAIKLALKDGEAKLASLNKDEKLELAWSAAKNISRIEAAGMSPDMVKAVFKADASKLPVFAGTALPGHGYALLRIAGVKAGEISPTDPRVQGMTQQYSRFVAEEEFLAWLTTLKGKYKVEISQSQLEKKEP